jgi:hypothetical protein
VNVPAGQNAVSHAVAHSAKSAIRGKLFEVNARHVAQTVRGGVEQRSQDARSCDLELTPELPLHPSPTIGDGWQCQEKGAIGEVGPADDIVNAIHRHSVAAENSLSTGRRTC